MLNLFKHQWLPDYIREYILKKFPTKHFKVTFEINGKDIPMDQVVGDERNIKKGTVTYTDAEGNSTMNWLFLYKGEISFDSVDHAVDNFTLEGIEPGVLVVIDKNARPKVDDIVVVLNADNENTLKQYKGKKNGKYVFAYMNEEKYPGETIELDSFVCQGVAKHMIKSF